MRALVNTAPGRLELLEVPMPSPGPGQVRIRTHACGICATDLKMLAGWERTGYPSIPGHEWSGVVDSVGIGVDHSLVGEHCVAENILADGGEVGFEYPGGYGEYFITVASNLYVLPQEFPLTTAILAEPLSVVLRALRRVDLAVCDRALVFGDGPIGILFLLMLEHFIAKEIYLVGGVRERMEIASRLGAASVYAFQAAADKLPEGIAASIGAEFPLVVEASGSAVALEASLKLVKRTGQVLVVGDYDSARSDFLWNDFMHREIHLLGSNTGAGSWEDTVRLLVESQIPFNQLVTHHFPVDQYTTAFEFVNNFQGSLLKAALIW